MRKTYRSLLIGAMVSATVGGVSTAVSAEDYGNWTGGCAAGWACMYEGPPATSVADSTYLNDSTFWAQTYHLNGHQLNDRVKYAKNRESQTIWAYSAQNYSGTTWTVASGTTSFALPFGVDNGASAVWCNG